MPKLGRRAIGVIAGAIAAPIAWGAPPNACYLLTPAEISSVVSVPVGAGVALNSPTTSSCKWLQEGVDSFKAVTVVVSTKDPQAYEAGKGVMHPEAVSGIGDEGYMTGRSLSYIVLSVKKGQNAFTITIHGLKDLATTQNAEKALGKTAATRI